MVSVGARGSNHKVSCQLSKIRMNEYIGISLIVNETKMVTLSQNDLIHPLSFFLSCFELVLLCNYFYLIISQTYTYKLCYLSHSSGQILKMKIVNVDRPQAIALN